MTAVALGAVILGVWTLTGIVFAPLVGARLAGRPMTDLERERLTWGGLAVFMALFTIAALLIGARP